jgi:hypothetical protein
MTNGHQEIKKKKRADLVNNLYMTLFFGSLIGVAICYSTQELQRYKIKEPEVVTQEFKPFDQEAANYFELRIKATLTSKNKEQAKLLEVQAIADAIRSFENDVSSLKNSDQGINFEYIAKIVFFGSILLILVVVGVSNLHNIKKERRLFYVISTLVVIIAIFSKSYSNFGQINQRNSYLDSYLVKNIPFIEFKASISKQIDHTQNNIEYCDMQIGHYYDSYNKYLISVGRSPHSINEMEKLSRVSFSQSVINQIEASNLPQVFEARVSLAGLKNDYNDLAQLINVEIGDKKLLLQRSDLFYVASLGILLVLTATIYLPTKNNPR